MKKNYFNFYSTLLFMLALLSFIVLNKEIYLAPNLSFSASLLIYPFTFLILSKMYNEQSVIKIKKSIYIAFILLLLFYLFISIINSLDSIIDTELISENLKEIFTPNYLTLSKINIYYPELINLLTYSLVFFLSHYIFMVAFEVFDGYTNSFTAYFLAFLLSFVIDQILFIPLTSIKYLVDNTLTYQLFIENLTASFIIVLISSVITLIIFLLTKKRN